MLDHHQYNKDPTLAEHHEQKPEHSQLYQKHQQQMSGQTKSPIKTPQRSYQTLEHHSQKLTSYTNLSVKESIVSDDLLDDTFGNVPLPNIHSDHLLLQDSEDINTSNQEVVEEEVEDVEATDQHELITSQNEDTEQHQPQSKEVADKSGAHNSSEFDIFGTFIAEVMKNMKRSQARLLQIKILNFISEFEESA